MSQCLLGTKRVQQSKAHKHLTTTERYSRQQYNVNVILLSTVHAMVLCTVGCTEVSLVKAYSLNHSMSIDKIFLPQSPWHNGHRQGTHVVLLASF